MQTTVYVEHDTHCRAAVEEYAKQLTRAGLPVSVSQCADLNCLCVEWAENRGQQPPADWEADDDLEGVDSPPHDEALVRMAEHYLRTIELLAMDSTTAESWLRSHSTTKREPKR